MARGTWHAKQKLISSVAISGDETFEVEETVALESQTIKHMTYQVELESLAVNLEEENEQLLKEQVGDPMIRDGKRSKSKYLIKILEFVDGFAVKS